MKKRNLLASLNLWEMNSCLTKPDRLSKDAAVSALEPTPCVTHVLSLMCYLCPDHAALYPIGTGLKQAIDKVRVRKLKV